MTGPGFDSLADMIGAFTDPPAKWLPVYAAELKPKDVYRHVGALQQYRVQVVDFFQGKVYVYCDGADDAVVFTRAYPLERLA